MTATQAMDASPTLWQVHQGHLALLAAWLVVVAAVSVREKINRRSRSAPIPEPPDPTALRGSWVWAAGAASLVSAAVHLAVTREHFEESMLYGTFFLLLAMLQVAWACWLIRRPSSALLVAGALASSLVVVLWLATRLVAIPLGPGAGTTEPFGYLDILASGAELVVAFCAAHVLRTATLRGRDRTPVA